MESLGARIKFLRECLGKSQTEMANLLGISKYTSFARYESGSRRPDKLALEKLASAGCTTVAWLIEGKVDRKVCEKIHATRMRFGKIGEVSQRLGVTRGYLRSMEDGRLAPSEAFISLLSGAFGLNKYELLAGTNPMLPALPSLRSDGADYEVERMYAFEEALSEAGLFEAWRELREMMFGFPLLVEKILSFLKRKNKRQVDEKTRYLQGQIDLLRGMLHDKTVEADALTLKKGELTARVHALQGHIKPVSKR